MQSQMGMPKNIRTIRIAEPMAPMSCFSLIVSLFLGCVLVGREESLDQARQST